LRFQNTGMPTRDDPLQDPKLLRLFLKRTQR
jgi:hypothetical protein